MSSSSPDSPPPGLGLVLTGMRGVCGLLRDEEATLGVGRVVDMVRLSMRGSADTTSVFE